MKKKEHSEKYLSYAWQEVAGYLHQLSLRTDEQDNQDGVTSDIASIKNKISTLEVCFSSFVLNQLSEDEREQLHNILLSIQEEFLNERSHIVFQRPKENVYNIAQYVNQLIDFFKEHANPIDFATIEKVLRAAERDRKKIQDQAKELLGELTTHSISHPFKEQAETYNCLTSWYTLLTIGTMVLLCLWILYFHQIINLLGININTNEITAPIQWNDIFIRILGTMPIVWLIIFFSKRRAENLKLHQSYLHKLILAQSYLNYLALLKKQYSADQEEISSYLHKIAVESLSLNPALLLDKTTSEQIPMENLLSKILEKPLHIQK